MNERLDNLNVVHIKDKKEFFINSILTNEVKLSDILSVDIFDNDLSSLIDLRTDEVLNQIESNRYVWLLKEHL